MDAVILAGGSGSRLECETPKVLIKVGGKPLLSYQLDYFLSSGVGMIVVALGHKSGPVVDFLRKYYKGRVHYTIEEKQLGTAGAIKQGLMETDSDYVLVTNGDDVTDIKISDLEKIRFNTICVAHPILPFGCVREDDGFARFVEKPLLNDWVSCGWYVLDRKELIKILPDTGSIEYDVFPGLKLRVLKHTGFWATLNSYEDIETFEQKQIPDVLK